MYIRVDKLHKRAEEFKDLLVLVNVYNSKIWHQINKVFKQFYCSCGYVPAANNKGMYTKLWTQDDRERPFKPSKCRQVLGSNHLGSVSSLRIQKFSRFFWSSCSCLVICSIWVNFVFWILKIFASFNCIFVLTIVSIFNPVLKEVSLLPTYFRW